MPTNPEVLTLLALGLSAGSQEELDHLAQCPECQAELAEYRRTVDLARSLEPDTLQRPAARVWEQIRADLGLGADTATEPVTAHPEITVPAGFGSDSVLGRATLFAQPHWSGVQGTAVIESDAHQHRAVRVRLQGEPAQSQPEAPANDRPEERVAVWLIAPDLSDMVHLGSMHAGPHALAGQDTTLSIPSDLDLLRYPVVDLSRQLADDLDDPDLKHSGDSIVRGVLS